MKLATQQAWRGKCYGGKRDYQPNGLHRYGSFCRRTLKAGVCKTSSACNIDELLRREPTEHSANFTAKAGHRSRALRRFDGV